MVKRKTYKLRFNSKFMLNTYKSKEPIKVMGEAKKAPLVTRQKQFLKDLLEDKLQIVRRIENLSEDGKRRIIYNHIYGQDKPDLYEKFWSDKDIDFCIHNSNLIVAWQLKDKSQDLREKIFYLCLRGLREGTLQFMEEARLINPEEVFDKKDICDYIEDGIKRRLKEDKIIFNYPDSNTFCDKIADGIASVYSMNLKGKKLEKALCFKF